MMASYLYDDEYLNKRFAGKVALCTASTAGIGYAAAERLAREGAKVVVCSRRQEKVDAAVKKLRDQNLEVSGIVCHQARKEDRQRLIDFTLATYGGIDLLFASAGVNPVSGPMLSVTEKQWDKMACKAKSLCNKKTVIIPRRKFLLKPVEQLFDVNVKSTFMIIRECVPYMIQRGGGAIVTNSTVAALFPECTVSQNEPYAVSKSTLTGLTKVLAAPLACHNIRINCIAPGPIETHFLKGFFQQIYPGITEMPPVRTYLQRVGDPAECGAVVAFLLSDDASFITGEIVTVDGGLDLTSKI